MGRAPSSSSSARRGRAAAVAAIAAVGVTVAVVSARRRRAPRAEPAPASRAALPEGRALIVTTEDGAHLAVTVAGPEGAPTVVLPHCWTGMRAIWAVVASRLVEAGHRVVLYDQRGHGQSTRTDAEPSMAVLGHDLRAVLEATDVTDVVLAGHSMGGMTIQAYAMEHPDHFRDHVEGVVLVSTAARTLGLVLPVGAVERVLGEGQLEWSRRGAMGRRVARGSLGQRPQRDHVDLTLEGFAATSGWARAGFLRAMASMDLRAAGPVLGEVPTTVLVGTRDTLTPVRRGRALADGIPGAELRVLPGAGHMLPLEAPDAIVEAIGAMTAARATADTTT